MEEQLERFMVFAHDRYYPSGGISDLEGFFKTKEEAEELVNQLLDTYDYAYIYDILDKQRL